MLDEEVPTARFTINAFREAFFWMTGERMNQVLNANPVSKSHEGKTISTNKGFYVKQGTSEEEWEFHEGLILNDNVPDTLERNGH